MSDFQILVDAIVDVNKIKEQLKEKLKEEPKEKLDIIQMKNHNTYSDFYNLNRTPVSNCSRIDTANLKFLNLKNYNPLNKQIFPQAKSLADKYNCDHIHICKLENLECLVMDINTSASKLLQNLPQNLECLILNLSCTDNINLTNLPTKLKYLKLSSDTFFYDNNNSNVVNLEYLPCSLTHLTINIKSAKLLLNNLPLSITHACVNLNFFKELEQYSDIKNRICI